MRNIVKKSLFIVLGCLATTTLFGAGTTPKSIDDGVQYFSAYAEAKTNLSSNDWVSTSGGPGNSGTSYSAPSGWLDGGSGKPGYGLMNVQSGKTITFTVTNITSVAILGAANNSSRSIILSVKTGGNEVGTAASTTGNSIQVLEYASELDKSKTYSITVSASDANNAKFYQIRFNGNGNNGGGENGGGENEGGENEGGENEGGASGGSADPNTPVPATQLTKHVPGLYEEKVVAGGYGTTLTQVNGRYFEVYYFSNQNSTAFFNAGASHLDSPAGYELANTTTFNIGWLDVNVGELSGSSTINRDEFNGNGSGSKVHYAKVTNSHSIKLHVQGFDQFSFIGREASDKDNKFFKVTINGVAQSFTHSKSDNTLYRFDLPDGMEAVIEITGLTSDENRFRAFSLREAQTPRVRRVSGNDTTQTVRVTESLAPIKYYLKNGQVDGAQTTLTWDNNTQATGISLSYNSTGDTLILGGVVNCQAGEYKYTITTTLNSTETSKEEGKFKVITDIKAKSDTIVDAYQGEEMEVIDFQYYALDASGITLTWKNDNAPAGITGSDKGNGHYNIGGITSATPGKYPFTITIAGSTTVITGYIEVISQDLGENPILYLYQTKSPRRGYENDGVFAYLTGKGINLQPRTAINKLRDATQYSKFKWILISEDVNANNEEVMAIAKGDAKLPVLNMKGFTYAEDRLGWGEPDNGSIDTVSHNGQYIFVQRPEHPIFKNLSAQTGSKIKIFDALEQNGVMPINIDYPNTFCLATAYTRNIEDYYKDGELQTAIHEIPADQHQGKKYICFPLSISSSKKLSSEAKTLLNNIVDYLLSSESAAMTAPKLQINSFKVGELSGKVDQNNNRIELVIDADKYPNYDLKALKPVVTLEDASTHVTPASGAEIDFQYSIYMPVDYVVTDYINRRVYEVVVSSYSMQSIDEVYNVGEWVNIFDVFGRKVATTNENIYTMELPRGIYIVVTENGNTLKITK